ncbi:MAG: DUF4160 domain-containing protein [Pseudobutyrivibrio sp.]|nr:DUF4160 domain-containing protein [Pseudobutyrivibrio sp.]
MPQVFKIGSYIVFFWIGEGEPLEPVHVHISEKKPTENATKIWITKSGKALLVNNNSRIPESMLRKMLRMIEANTDKICDKWLEYFDEISYYC